jgi:hypothetical protein
MANLETVKTVKVSSAALDVTAVVPPETQRVKGLSPEKAHGVKFVTFLLWAITVVVFFQLSFLAVKIWKYNSISAAYHEKFLTLTTNSTNLTVETLKTATESVIEQQKAFQDFWLQITQFILGSVFLPLITALLGYIFGTKEASEVEKNR